MDFKNTCQLNGLQKVCCFFLSILILFLITTELRAADKNTLRNITQSMEKHEGFYTFYWDNNEGRLLLRIDNLGQEFIYQAGLATGLGSNDIGIDRAQIGRSKLVRFDKVGNKVLLRHINTKYKSVNGDIHEKRAVRESFPDSILWGFKALTEDNGSVLIDMTDFLLSDQYGIQERLRRTDQGAFSIDQSRSTIYMSRTKSFPMNTEIEVEFTLTGDGPGAQLRKVAATPTALTIRQHFSFIKLPDADYKTRKYNVHSSFTPHGYFDPTVSLTQPLNNAVIARHRLEKKNPEAKISEAIEPIIYYIDPAMPEPIRSAVTEGAMFWNQAFEAAGYKDAFQVKLRPAHIDPLDARYNVINWVHRKNRGYSYGGYVLDPRTGEIIKGNVTIGSLRARQNMLMANGMTLPFDNKASDGKQSIEFAMARHRQLAAHEVGHSIGLAHNSIASTSPYDRASVMDDPYPWVRIDDQGGLDFSSVYYPKIGEWDKVSIQYGYGDYPKNTDIDVKLNEILELARDKGLRFFSHHRVGAYSYSYVNGHLYSSIWDVGHNTVDALDEMLKVRKIALNNFSVKAIPVGQPLSSLEETLVPLYYHHRYQLEAAVKYIGGMDYEYALRREDSEQIKRTANKGEQIKALKVILKALRSDELLIPEHILKLIPPKALGDEPTRESFPRKSSLYLGLDPLEIGESLSNHILGLILDPTRLARVYEFGLRDEDQLKLKEYISFINDAVFNGTEEDGLKGALIRRVQYVYMYHLMHLANDNSVSMDIRSFMNEYLLQIKERLRLKGNENIFLQRLLDQFLRGSFVPDMSDLASMPPSEPI